MIHEKQFKPNSKYIRPNYKKQKQKNSIQPNWFNLDRIDPEHHYVKLAFAW